MKRKIKTITTHTLITIIALILASPKGFSQENPLEKISATYLAFQTIQAEFSFQYFRNDQDATGHRESGKLFLDQKEGKYRISTLDQELISDGKTQWAVLREADEVQITNVPDQDGSISPKNVFTFFRTGYSYKELSNEKIGTKTLKVLELTPEDKRQHHSKIKLRIDQQSNQIHDVTIYDKNNSRYSYRITNLKTNQVIDSKKFVFDKNEFPGMELVDLR